jgi:hypothetical protein
MKSIGNGWKRAQEAGKRAWLNEAKTGIMFSYEPHQQAYMRDQAIRAMSPEAMKAKAEREAPLMQNAYAAEYAFGSTSELTLWQRIKRDLRAL